MLFNFIIKLVVHELLHILAFNEGLNTIMILNVFGIKFKYISLISIVIKRILEHNMYLELLVEQKTTLSLWSLEEKEGCYLLLPNSGKLPENLPTVCIFILINLSLKELLVNFFIIKSIVDTLEGICIRLLRIIY